MNTEKTISQMRKGVLEFCTLAVIAREEEVYASDILTRLKESELIVVEGTLYPLLTRLKNENMLSYRWEESRSGPPRKYYRITGEGLAMLKAMQTGWEQLVESVEKITKENPS